MRSAPFVRAPSKNAIEPDLDKLMPNQPAIEDEVMSLVGSTDCLTSSLSTPVDLVDDANKILGSLNATTAIDPPPLALKGLRETAGKLKGPKILKSKLCDKKVLTKKAEPVVLLEVNRTRTFIANVTKTIEETPPMDGTFGLLKRDNTFDILDNKSVVAAVKEKVQETPVFKATETISMKRCRPKMLLLEQQALTHPFDSPLRFSLDNVAASTPMDLNVNATHDVVAENTFQFENTPRNATRTITQPDDKEATVNLMRFDSETNLTMPVNRVVATLSSEETFRCSSIAPRESFGLLTESQMLRLEEPLLDQSLIGQGGGGNQSNNEDKTLVAKVLDDAKLSSCEGATVDKVAPLYNPQRDPFGGCCSLNSMSKVAQRLSFSKFPDVSLSCSVDLDEVSNPVKATTPTHTESNSYEMEDSLGILTPDQMKEFGDTMSRPSLDLLLLGPGSAHQSTVNLRVEQTPSPEELPLDPPLPSLLSVAMLTGTGSVSSGQKIPPEMEKSDFSEMTESVMKTSSHSKGSHLESSVITSVTSITSLDTGYQGDGEMSRPASRNAMEYRVQGCSGGGSSVQAKLPAFETTTTNARAVREAAKYNEDQVAAAAEALGPPVVRRQDPMTDSDFFTESDADDIFNRGDRRAQIIDGQLYGQQMLQNVVVIGGGDDGGVGGGEETSGMESSGVFTDAEQIKEEELQFDMSPDDRSTETVQSQRIYLEEDEDQHEDLNGTIRMVARVNGCDNDGRTSGGISSDKMEVDDMIVDLECGASSKQGGGGGGVIAGDTAVGAVVVNSNKTAAKRGNPASRRSNSSSPPIIKKKMVEQQTSQQQQQQPVTPCAKVSVPKVMSGAKKTPNKWDAVMSKIAQNQSATQPKNYNEVKSRVNSAPRSRGDGGDVDSVHHNQQQQAALIVVNKSGNLSARNSPSSKQQQRPENVFNPSKR